MGRTDSTWGKLIYCQLKMYLVGERETKLKCLPLPFPRFNFTPFFLTWELGVVSVRNSSSLPLPPPHTFPWSWVFPTGCSPSQAAPAWVLFVSCQETCSSVDSPQVMVPPEHLHLLLCGVPVAAVWPCARAWPSMGYRPICSSACTTSSPSFFLDLDVFGAVYCSFIFLLLTCTQHFALS